ncbi:AtpZ/AtpI family protein [Limisalsivibrio acetivorans]|uniref:AtpZ/AtpI family protein n=1 Tax=Limisalsivibrio acetivorans TaxID=1304888 RepID=UPI0003B4A850|nr:AtpZ/AtpI family protein [Limisalsivibrio acetivorans]
MLNKDKESKTKKADKLLHASSIGMSFVFSIVIGTGMGVWLDSTFGTKPYLTLIFMVLGIAAGFKNMFYFMRKAGLFDEDSE